MAVTPAPVKPGLLARTRAFLESKHGRHVVTVVIVYVVTELERRGYLPAIPIPKP